MIIDVHGHIGRSADLDGDLRALDEYVSRCGLHRLLLSNLRAAAVGEPAPDLHESDANLAVLTATERRPRLTPVYWARPGRPDSHPQAVAGALETEPFVALLLAPRLNDFNIDDAILDPYMLAASRVNRPLMVLSGRDERSRPTRVYNLGRRFPRLPIVLLNSGADAHWHEAIECVQQAAKTGDANLYLSTAHVPHEETFAAIDRVGPPRVLFGSDALALGADHAETTLKSIERLRRDLPPDSSRAVLGGNALELFVIPRD